MLEASKLPGDEPAPTIVCISSMKRIIFFLMCLCAFSVVSAQDKKKDVPFNGIVEDVIGTPIKGAKIWVVSPVYYTTSDKHGKFGLTNVKSTDTVHVKYQKRVFSIPVDTLKSMRIRIADELLVREEEEMVNTGFGFVKRRESCSATSGIPGEVLVRTGRINVLEAMQGLVPGVLIMNGKVTIRSVATPNGDPTPLFLVDNVEVPSLDFVNIYDVDRVDVLKDANMYGAKGGNGAILVTTKRGMQRARR